MARPFRIIDAHAHVYSDPGWSPRKLIHLMDRAGIDMSAAFASSCEHEVRFWDAAYAARAPRPGAA